MNCPNCNIPLLMTDRKGVEIDYCSQCRGVWLDRGELDKIIDLTMNERMGAGSRKYSMGGNNQTEQSHSGYRSEPMQHHRQSYKHHKPHYKYKKKKSMLGEIFDIFD